MAAESCDGSWVFWPCVDLDSIGVVGMVNCNSDGSMIDRGDGAIVDSRSNDWNWLVSGG